MLRSAPLAAGSPDELARSATTALQRLADADALRSPDVTAPLVTAHPASASTGEAAVTLRFDVFDDSGRSRALVRVYEVAPSCDSPLADGVQDRHPQRSRCAGWFRRSSAPGSFASASLHPTRRGTEALQPAPPSSGLGEPGLARLSLMQSAPRPEGLRLQLAGT